MIDFKDHSTQVFYSIKFIFILRYQFMLLKTAATAVQSHYLCKHASNAPGPHDPDLTVAAN